MTINIQATAMNICKYIRQFTLYLAYCKKLFQLFIFLCKNVGIFLSLLTFYFAECNSEG